ncbi:MAG: hypothetical protein ACK4PR_06010 [Gammaproteobacteria bacterium]
MLPISRRSGERVYLVIKGYPPIHITPIIMSERIPLNTELVLNIEAPQDVKIVREENLEKFLLNEG